MSKQWMFKSETYDNCNCSVSCGCQFNEPTTHGNCKFAYVGHIVEGHFDGTPIDGLNSCDAVGSTIRSAWTGAIGANAITPLRATRNSRETMSERLFTSPEP